MGGGWGVDGGWEAGGGWGLETFESFKFGFPPAVEFSKVSDGLSRDSAFVPKNAKETPSTSKAAKRTNAPTKTVTWTRLELCCW